ncbi:hypothetical protein SAMN05216466_107138 [Paraburkholderia phenazinium]|uniref:Uncharacterized protein n=1 Tax=Paraburkholderia phenazinium TaxID=60549 RepID=A0A1G7ZR93_9BURK|nr:hypothetical protein [Paraburkholderia phenazinium]SDH11097.1 hypothetical protein SAMN05216466_107138 [Paraburkholderia phenazinium]
MFRTPHKNEDLRHVATSLEPSERLAAVNENKRLQAIRALGNRWLLAKDYDGHYQPELHARGAR